MSVVDEIKDRIDAIELISSYVQLKRAGRNYKGLCPFHAENTASFVVFPDTGTWHCFGACGEGGDIFTFVMKREGWDFRTALEELARRAGVELEQRTQKEEQEDQERVRLREILAAAATYYHDLLRRAPQAQRTRDYLANRGLSDNTIGVFSLGYALEEWHALETYLIDKGYAKQELVAAGMLVDRDDGSVYDRFRGRLMIPIGDVRGRVIGFGARTLDREGTPKYLNSPQTPVFDKGNTLFGLHQAVKGIREAARAVVVEGYMDVMQAHQAGFTDVVAQLGTALTDENLRRLTRYSKRVILALDADAAGKAATMRGLEVAQEALDPEWQPVFNPRGLIHLEARFSADVRVMMLPAGQDPDDVIRNDPSMWAQLVDAAVPLVDHYMASLMEDQDLADPKVISKITEAMVPVIRAVGSPVERAHYAQKLARSLRVDERSLLNMVATVRRHRQTARRQPSSDPGPEPSAKLDLEVHCLRGLVQIDGLYSEANDMLAQLDLEPISYSDFDNPENREIFVVWRKHVESGSVPLYSQMVQAVPVELHTRLIDLFDGSWLTLTNKKWLVEAQVKPGQDVFDLKPREIRQDLLTGVLKLRQRNLLRRNAQLRFLLEDADDVEARSLRRSTGEMILALQRLQRTLASRPWSEEQSPAGSLV